MTSDVMLNVVEINRRIEEAKEREKEGDEDSG